ncbi:MAG: STAS domain-containing protein [Gammaproteobacteria bacterium]|nr:STAS domain-containing protein [Gammaproteobacteria bacterium]
MSNKDSVDIGFDPLAWMNEDDSDETSEAQTESSPTTKAVEQSSVERSVEEKDDSKKTEAENAGSQSAQGSGNDSRIDLAGKVDIASASELKQELTEALNQGGAITFVATNVERADGAGLQLLTSFVRELDDNHRELIWEEPSEQLVSAANIVGLKEALHLP